MYYRFDRNRIFLAFSGALLLPFYVKGNPFKFKKNSLGTDQTNMPKSCVSKTKRFHAPAAGAVGKPPGAPKRTARAGKAMIPPDGPQLAKGSHMNDDRKGGELSPTGNLTKTYLTKAF